MANAEVSNQRSTVGSDNVPSPMRFGRLPVPVLTVAALRVGVKGKPVWKMEDPVDLPPAKQRTPSPPPPVIHFRPLPNGSR